MKPKIIFFGTSEFGAIILEGLISGGYRPVLVITAADKPVGRKQIFTPPPVKTTAQKYNIPLLQPEILTNCKLPALPAGRQTKNYKPDLIIAAAYGKIIPKEILEIPKYGCLNVHPSLLPKYRGPSPIQTAILNGDKETGTTIILMDEKIDHGPVVANSKFQILSLREISRRETITKITYRELHNKLAKLGLELLVDIIPKWIAGKIKPKPQDEKKASYTKIIKKEDGKIDWSKPASQIERQIRAFEPWPGTFTKIKNSSRILRDKAQNDNLKYKILKILEADILKTDADKKVGEVFLTDDKKLAVQTGQNCLILRKLQIEGKKPMTAQEFLLGHSNIIGSILK